MPFCSKQLLRSKFGDKFEAKASAQVLRKAGYIQEAASLAERYGESELYLRILLEDLDNSIEILTEAIQTIIRKNNIPNGYEIMKDLSRGKKITEEDIDVLINSLKIPSDDKNTLLELKSRTYTGLASKLSRDL